MYQYITTFISGILSGGALGLTGGGGSILAVPLLVYLVGENIHLAIITSLLAVGFTSLIASVSYMQKKLVRFKIGVIMAAPALISTFLGSLANKNLKGPVLLILFSFLMIYIGYRMFKGKKTTEIKEEDKTVNYKLVILLGFITGLASGFFGVGGGFLLVPALYIGANLKMQEAVATSLFIIFLFGLFGLGSYLIQGRQINYLISAIFIAGGALGGFLGSRIAENLDQKKLRLIFSIFTVAMGVFILIENSLKLL